MSSPVRTAHAFSLADDLAVQMRPVGVGWLIGLLVASAIFYSCLGQEPPLPKPMGALNDYAAAIGNSRPALEAALTALQSRAGIQATILITLLDPFDDPDQLATRIRTDWKIPGTKAVFALFVKETDTWIARIWLSADLSERFASGPQAALEKQMKQDLQQRRVSQAVRETVDALTQTFLPPEPPKPPAGNPPANQGVIKGTRGLIGWMNPVVFYGAVALLAVLLVIIGIRALLYHFCPQCAGRLRVRQSRTNRVYYCERCGATYVRPRAR